MAEQHQPEVGRRRCRTAGLVATVIAAALIPPSAPATVDAAGCDRSNLSVPASPVAAADGGSAVCTDLIAGHVVEDPIAATDPAERGIDVERLPTSSGPRIIDGAVADALVLVRGGAVCSGTPIAGTRYVATAAHCVLDRAGRPARRTVVRDDVTHHVAAVWVDVRYAGDPTPRFDAAILELDRDLPGPSATFGPKIPPGGSATVAGYQPIDTDGTLLRGEGPHDRPAPQQTPGHLITIDSVPAGCTASVNEITVTTERIDVPCGLVPGASGGGLFVHTDGAIGLIGIISTVAHDLTSNGVAPMASLAELLRQPARYRYSRHAMTNTVHTLEVMRR